MCTIRRSKIKRLIKQQRKISVKPIILINFNAFPKIDFQKAWDLLNTKGVLFCNSVPSVKTISTRPRNL